MEERTAITQSTEQTAPALIKKIGKTMYIVHIHFSKTSKETMSDKMSRLIKNDILHNT